MSLGEKVYYRYAGREDLSVSAYSTRRLNQQTGEYDILTTVRVAPIFETSDRAGVASRELQGFTRLPRFDKGYEEGRTHEKDENGRTIVSVQVFSYPGAIPEIKLSKPTGK